MKRQSQGILFLSEKGVRKRLYLPTNLKTGAVSLRLGSASLGERRSSRIMIREKAKSGLVRRGKIVPAGPGGSRRRNREKEDRQRWTHCRVGALRGGRNRQAEISREKGEGGKSKPSKSAPSLAGRTVTGIAFNPSRSGREGEQREEEADSFLSPAFESIARSRT